MICHRGRGSKQVQRPWCSISRPSDYGSASTPEANVSAVSAAGVDKMDFLGQGDLAGKNEDREAVSIWPRGAGSNLALLPLRRGLMQGIG